MTKFQPLHDKVLIRPDETQTVSPGGVFLVQSTQQKPSRGIVIAVGPGRKENGVRLPMDVKIGDHVSYSQWGSAQPVNIDGIEHALVAEADIQMLITEE